MSDHGQQQPPAEKLPSHYPRGFGTPAGSERNWIGGSYLQETPDGHRTMRIGYWARLFARVPPGTTFAGMSVLMISTFIRFMPRTPSAPGTPERIARLDFANPKFGCSEISGRGYIGRRVDLLGRALNVPVGADLAESLRVYLESPRTGITWELGKKAVALLEPRMGEIVWPLDGIQRVFPAD